MRYHKVRIVKDEYDDIYINREDILLLFYLYKDLVGGDKGVLCLLDDLIKKFSSLE